MKVDPNDNPVIIVIALLFATIGTQFIIDLLNWIWEKIQSHRKDLKRR